jgi:putative endonuclease
LQIENIDRINLCPLPTPHEMTTGERGEEIVAQWILSQGGKIVARRWRWRGGEIDLIAILDRTLLFIEVKTRSRGNWDEDGLMAITQTKQQKLILTAQIFISNHPELAEMPCQFDVALVRHQSLNLAIPDGIVYSATECDRQERLILLRYLSGAFES